MPGSYLGWVIGYPDWSFFYGMLHQLGHNSFLPNPFKLIIYRFTYQSELPTVPLNKPNNNGLVVGFLLPKDPPTFREAKNVLSD